MTSAIDREATEFQPNFRIRIRRGIAGKLSGSDIFLPISPAVRILIVAYLLIYRVVLPFAAAMFNPDAQPLLGLRVTAELVYALLLAYPFLFAKREYGWLHPLVLPLVLNLGKSLTKNPFSLFFPFDSPVVDLSVASISRAVTMQLPLIDLAWLNLQYTLLLCLAQAAYLAAFLFGPKITVPLLTLYRPKRVRMVSIAFAGTLFLIVVGFILSQGGVNTLLVAMRGGRSELFEGSGQYLFAAAAMISIVAVWFMYEDQPWKNPFLLAAIALSVVLGIITTGSRSGAILAVLSIILLWWKRRGQVLILPTMGAALLGLLILGGFGAIRQDYSSDTVNTEAFNPLNYGATLSRALEDIKNRGQEDSTLAALAGANKDGLLWGTTYVYAVSFWVPRAIWPDKPRSADSYNYIYNYRGFSRNITFDDVSFYGFPVNAVTEAFWNFSYLGVILVFGLLGMLHQHLARAASVYRGVPFFWVVYIIMLSEFDGSTKDFVDLARTILLLLIFAFCLGVVRIGTRQRPVLRTS
ncbi:oligosaccharide repeat unit polymerase [Sphingomonas canadensis]|uniref:Oligosaccharide repeat unit polymerase n=1 Tax=Sphingomonas canadensis TaxID=1219257 RepID=A0ABW3H7T4_9SPHN|nr:oligosaccharide repeat unit polymerase [Sphingomonas canadensis]MCW3837113.1 oligosaccharide repeat unit polymerase [Sphingomonas canadensis]